ncbi:MAG: amino acid adenylation domain-containing protein, partial [Cyclobacteriaceae bacterium]
MRPARIISQLAKKGIGISLEDGRLKVSGEKGSITPAIQEELRHNKEEIVAFLDSRTVYQSRKPIPVAPDSTYHPLSQAQRRMWVMAQMEGAEKIYNLPAMWLFRASLDQGALARSLDRLTARHEVLRTTFHMVEGEPVQQILPDATSSLKAEAAADADEAKRLAEEVISQPFDLRNDLLLRVRLYALPTGEHMLLLVIHHLVADGLSLTILLDEWLYLYGLELEGKSCDLAPLCIQYKDFVHWQQALLADGGLKSDRAFWHDRMSGELPVLELPYKDSRPAVQTFNGARRKVDFNKEALQNLQKLSEQEGGSLFMTLLSLVNVLLYKYSGQEDIICGTTISGREHPDLEGQIGLYLNTLALRNQVSGKESFRSLVSRISADTLQAFSHSRYPFDQLVEELDISRDLSRSALFDVLVELQNFADLQMDSHGDTAGAGLDIQPLEPESDVARVDLNFVFAEEAEGLVLALEYNTDLFAHDQVHRMCLHLQQLANELSAKPDSLIGEHSLVTEEETRELESFQGVVCELETATILPVWQQVVQQHAAKTALHFGDTERYTYKELDEQTTAIAHWLDKNADVQSGDIVGMLLPRTPRLLTGILGAWKAGGAYIPMDPAHPQSRLEDITIDSGMKVVVTGREAIDKETRALLSKHVKLVDWEDLESGLSELDGKPLSYTPGPDDLAYVIYTSGSTGKPKGAMVEHKGMLNHLLAKVEDLQMTAESIVAQNATQNFDISVWQMFAALLTGGRTVMIGEDEVLSPTAFLQRIENEQVNILEVVPSYLRVLLDYLESSEATLAVDYLMVTGEELPAALATAWFDRYPHIPLVNAYGPTEASDDITHYLMERMPEGLSRVPIGHVVRNFRIYVVDRDGKLCPPWVKGELWVSGLGVGQGYLNDEAKTTAAFLYTDPFVENGKRLYRTGDLGRYLPDGRLEFYGRLDNQVKVRGHRIELGEIESKLLKIPGVKQAAVKVWGDTDKYLCGYVVGDATTEVISSQLSKTLPAYMVPQRWVRLDTMPLNSSSKTDRHKLSRPEGEIEREYIAPSTPIEETLAAIWQEVLGVEKIGVTDNFFQMGGDSIKAILTTSKARLKGYRFEMPDVFECGTIRDLSLRVREETTIADQSPVSGEVPLSPIQAAFFSTQTVAPHHYNVSVMLRWPSKLPHEQVQAIFDTLLQHHDALRMIFDHKKGLDKAFIQDIHDMQAEVQTFDLRGIGGEVEKKVSEIASGLQESIDLEKGPLLKAGHFHMQGEDRLLVVAHHAVMDGISWRILLEDLQVLINLAEKGEPLQLQPKTESYKKWMESLLKWADSEKVEGQVNWWQELASTNLASLQADMPAGVDKVKDARSESFELNREQTDALTRVNTVYGINTSELLLAALSLSLKKTFGHLNTLVEVETHGREPVVGNMDLSRTVGWFTNFYPVLLQADDDRGTGYHIKQVKETLRRVPENGRSYNVLRYLKGTELPLDTQIGFNFMGQFNDEADEALKVAGDDIGSQVSPEELRPHTIEVSGMVYNGCLTVHIEYGSQRFLRDTIMRWAAAYREALERIISESAEKKEKEITPSDLGYKD